MGAPREISWGASLTLATALPGCHRALAQNNEMKDFDRDSSQNDS